MSDVSSLLAGKEELSALASSTTKAIHDLKESVAWLIENATDANNLGAASYHLLMQAGLVIGGWQMARAAAIAADKLASGFGDKEFLQAKIITAQFYVEHSLPQAEAHAVSMRAGAESMMALTPEQFAIAQH